MRGVLLSLCLVGALCAADVPSSMEQGDNALFAGEFEKAITHYDAVVKARPESNPHLWQRGIAYYYAGRFKEGVAQFDRHKLVNPHDVENAAWHFLCKARETSVSEARRGFIPVEGDARVPMREVHALFGGGMEPDEVIAAAKQSDPAERARAMCYAHQYVGLYYEVMGRPDRAQAHMRDAAETFFFANYMGQVARVHLKKMKAERAVATVVGDNPTVMLRGGLRHSQNVFEKGGAARVAFIGGSITEANGWRQMIYKQLAVRFPKTQFHYVAAGMSSTGSTTGAARLGLDVLSKGKVDLLFIEFAVNDNQDSERSTTAAIRGMEGMVQQARSQNPDIDIVFSYFVNGSHIKDYHQGVVPNEIASHERVAEHYHLPSIHLAREVADAIKAGAYSFGDYGGTHPKEPGQKVYAERVDVLFKQAWPTEHAASVAEASPAAPLDRLSYSSMSRVETGAMTLGAWVVGEPDWKAKKGSLRAAFKGKAFIHCEAPGKPLAATFTGTAIGAFVLAGPDAGVLEYSIDGAKFRRVTLYHRFSRGLHYPRTVMFDDELMPGAHKIVIRIAEKSEGKSKGTAARILYLVEN